MNFWNNFAARHPAAAKWVREGGLFVIVSNLITVFKYLLLQFLPGAFHSLPVVDFGWPGIDITLFGETFKWNILGYDAAHGGLPYFCAYMVAMIIGECINFPIQQADRLVYPRILRHHLHRQLHQLRVGGCGRPIGAGLYLQHRYHHPQWRYLYGDLLLCQQGHLPGGRGQKGVTLFYDILTFHIIFLHHSSPSAGKPPGTSLCSGRFVVVLGDFPRGENSFLENEKKLPQNPCTFALYRGKIKTIFFGKEKFLKGESIYDERLHCGYHRRVPGGDAGRWLCLQQIQ